MVMDAPVSATPEPAVAEGPGDATLVAAVRRGDDRAFEQLYSRYQRRISAYVYGMVKDHGRAEDITQEVFISALRRMRETDRAIAFKPWIYEIAKNACIDQFRRSRRAEEISMDAGEGLGQADHGRLAAAEPTPDDAVDAKQQLDHLCGAFGGLSDSHHEILVLREFEGLSYREIGDRMGLSRPGVESTLFRARKRLTEEYDELVSGQRCARIQSIIAAAGGTAPGTRDARRLARHVSHCQPCRRMAMAAGLDISSLPRTPVRRAIERVAGFLPLPAFLRARFFASEQMVPVSEPMAAAWSKAVAAGAALLVAGVGAGVAPHAGGKPPAHKPDSAKPAAAHTRSASSSGGTRVRRPLAVAPRKQAVVKSTSHTGGKRSASLGKQRSSAPSSAGTPSVPATPAGGSTQPAATSPTSSTPNPTRGVHAPTGGVHAPTGGGTGTTTPSVPKVTLPKIETPVGSTPVGGAVEKTVNDVTDTVNQATGNVQDTVNNVTGGLLTP
jgi:RNA polymerase sigma factor (sigma-70 family)